MLSPKGGRIGGTSRALGRMSTSGDVYQVVVVALLGRVGRVLGVEGAGAGEDAEWAGVRWLWRPNHGAFYIGMVGIWASAFALCSATGMARSCIHGSLQRSALVLRLLDSYNATSILSYSYLIH